MDPKRLAKIVARAQSGGEGADIARGILGRLGHAMPVSNLPARVGASSPRVMGAIGSGGPPRVGTRTAFGGGPRALGPGPRRQGPLRPPPMPPKPPSTGSSFPAPTPPPAKGNPGFRKRTLMGIGLGMGVAAGVAMNRRGEGASSGRQSIYKY